MSRIAVSLFAVLASALPATALAQRGSEGPIPRPGNSGLPKVGTMIPEVTILDDQGNEFSTKSLRGQYSVLVFGCLT